jgi:hypothetical protein
VFPACDKEQIVEMCAEDLEQLKKAFFVEYMRGLETQKRSMPEKN